mgnify:CR=1 FL=1
MPDHYTNGELGILIKQVGEDLRSFSVQNAKEHKEVIEHQKITNGRVNKLEGWKNKLIGGLILANIVIVPMFFLIFH